ncbi:hypothetical protein [Halorientalis sp.]|jgi:hypothetical protein|uniref:hypothetical protein n=1 Tax=Halorientalis sp. TaxID=1931229 RepID=UPI00261BB9F3|nr:hypothetical protein [Halorientalis sp.]
MNVPDEPPVDCPVCETAYESVSVHERGLMVNLTANERYRRVCFEPVARDGRSVVRFYHHTHEQADTASGEGAAEGPHRGVPADSNTGG